MRQLKHSSGQFILHHGLLVRRQPQQVVVRIALGASLGQRTVLKVGPDVARGARRRCGERAVLERKKKDELGEGVLWVAVGGGTYAICVLFEDHGAGEACRVVKGAL